MLIVRLQRVGRRNDPSFRVVVTEKKGPPRGKYMEKVGTYDVKRGNVVFDNERVLYWISQGAKPTPTVHNLLVSAKVIEGKKIKNHKHAVPVKEATVETSVAQEVAAEVSKVEVEVTETKQEVRAEVVSESQSEAPSEEVAVEEPAVEPQVEEVVTEVSPVEVEEIKVEPAEEEAQP